MAKMKQEGKKVHARLVRRGDIVKLGKREEVVREVQIVLQLADGTSEPLDSMAEVEILPQPPLPE